MERRPEPGDNRFDGVTPKGLCVPGLGDTAEGEILREASQGGESPGSP